MSCAGNPLSTVLNVTFLPTPCSADKALATKMPFNRNTRNLPGAIAWRELVHSVTKRQVLHPFKTSALPTNLVGKGASAKNLIDFTCSNETSALCVNDQMVEWDCDSVLTIPDIGDDCLTLSNVVSALNTPSWRRTLLLPPFDHPWSSLYQAQQYQRWFYHNASSEALSLASLALAIMERNVDEALRAQVDEDTCDLPALEQGVITTVAHTLSRCCTERDRHTPALQRALEKFSFCAYHYYVTRSKKILMTIIHALGPDQLPPNVACRIFMALATAPNTSFSQVCSAKANAQFGIANSDIPNIMLFINDQLNGLEDYYIECLGDGTWIKKFSQASGLFSRVDRALAITNVSPPDPLLSSVDRDCAQAYFLAALASAKKGEKTILPFAEWVKTHKCHWCGNDGHIRPACPKKKAGVPQLTSLVKRYNNRQGPVSSRTSQNPRFHSMMDVIAKCHDNRDFAPSTDDLPLSTGEEDVASDVEVETDASNFNAFCAAMGSPDSGSDSDDSDFS